VIGPCILREKSFKQYLCLVLLDCHLCRLRSTGFALEQFVLITLDKL
jgi:hypothetical protein